ncbi:hypothetical protein [Neorhizobium sp. T25_27]|uniref:hypothetical protein n=1 Tax=Neorhizobium sp. T25_27 TaxID=2093831 RepID=UPI000CF9EF88|nr:hypothetical protein [Neorhizobium sp. T25_27]
MSDVSVRVYVVEPTSELNLLLDVSTSYFGNTCPAIGDVISLFDDDRHFKVSQRQFLPAKERDKGWAVMCWEVTEPMFTNSACTWAMDSDWVTEWHIAQAQERLRTMSKELKARKRKKP